MTELLAPAGNMEALKASISNGCDAVYLGMEKFGARAYSSNFDLESLREAIVYAHLREVKIYVTMNTIVFEDELDEMRETLNQLNEIGVDGIIVQDMAVFDYVANNFVDMEVHCSTQMGIDDAEGALLFKKLGADRIVLAREVDIEKAAEIRSISAVPIEIFIHGALCVSYSGNCLMSGLIGYRSGNRGRCVGSCRKPYQLINTKTGESYGEEYYLSTKDLNTIEYIDELKQMDSLKIEGRMKEPAYVANVVSKYRLALDGEATDKDREDLNKTFNRTYTKGYLFGEDIKDITNIQKPNNFGFEIGKITRAYKGMYEITLKRVLNQNDIIRIDHNNEDVNLSVVRLYDKNGDLINRAERTCYIKIKEKLSMGDIVYKTKDYLYYKELDEIQCREFRRFSLDIKVYAYPASRLIVEAEGLGGHCSYESDEILGEAINNPTTKEQVIKQFARLKDTVFCLNDVEYEECNAFIPAKMLNAARREIVSTLYQQRLRSKKKRNKSPQAKEAVSFASQKPYLTAAVTTREQYDACVKCGIEEIYFDNIIRRNQNSYEDKEGTLLIGGYGGIYRYRDSNPIVADYSFNVVNSVSCYELYRLGAKRVTLSYELNKMQIKELIDSYYEQNGGYPALEMIVYGRAPLMFTKYCPLKKMNLCGQCRTNTYQLRDEYGTFPVISHEDCSTTILNGKRLNLLDEMPFIDGIEGFRLNFTVESADQVVKVVKGAQRKLTGASEENLFDRERDTRGHFNKEIL